LTVVRRLAIFVLAVALLINSVLMVLAKSANDRKQGQGPLVKVKAYVSSRDEALKLAKELKLEEGRYRIMEVPLRKQVPGSGWFVEMQLTQFQEQADNISNTLRTQYGLPVKVETNDDGSRVIRLKESFASKAEAGRRAAEIGRKTNGVFSFTAERAMRVVTEKAWCLEVSVNNAETVRSLKERLKGKATLDVR